MSHFKVFRLPVLCVSVFVCVCVCAECTPIQKQLPEMPPRSLFTFCILSGALIQKPEPSEWPTTGDCGEVYPSPSTSLFLSSIPLFSPFLKGFSPSLFNWAPPLPEPPPASSPPLFPRPSLERVASECQMYYRASHGNVNTQPCHESRVVWPPSFPALPPLLPLSSPPSFTTLAARRVEKAQNSKGRLCVCWSGDRGSEEAGV